MENETSTTGWKWTWPWIALGLALGLGLGWLAPQLREAPAPVDSPSVPEAVSPDAVTAEPAPTPAPASTQPAADLAADAVARAAPAVVNISAQRTVRLSGVRGMPPELGRLFGDIWPEYRDRVEASLGSGVIYDKSGHVVTNFHVIDGASQATVELQDGRTAAATLVGVDRDTDLAVLRIDLDKLPTIRIGQSARLRVGETALAIGNPLGLGQTVTQGIISATGRGRLGVSTFENFIQTDAAINSGNSGGALINTRGELVGINTAVIARNAGIEGIGFAIPADLVRGVVEAILKEGRVVRGWIGIQPRSLTPDEARQFGFPAGAVVVMAVYRNTPAAAEGLRQGDVITEIDGAPVQGAEDLLVRVAARAPGQQVRLTLRRGPPFEGQAREHRLQVEVTERPAQALRTS